MKEFKIVRITDSAKFSCELIKETKCYYVVSVKGLYREAVEMRFHKNTMHIKHLYLSLYVEDVQAMEEIADIEVIINSDKSYTTSYGLTVEFKEAIFCNIRKANNKLIGKLLAVVHVDPQIAPKVAIISDLTKLYKWDAITTDKNNVICQGFNHASIVLDRFPENTVYLFINDRIVIRAIERFY